MEVLGVFRGKHIDFKGKWQLFYYTGQRLVTETKIIIIITNNSFHNQAMVDMTFNVVLNKDIPNV